MTLNPKSTKQVTLFKRLYYFVKHLRGSFPSLWLAHWSYNLWHWYIMVSTSNSIVIDCCAASRQTFQSQGIVTILRSGTKSSSQVQLRAKTTNLGRILEKECSIYKFPLAKHTCQNNHQHQTCNPHKSQFFMPPTKYSNKFTNLKFSKDGIRAPNIAICTNKILNQFLQLQHNSNH